ncbi:PBP1A family penicillin-binding protein [Oceanobacillus piezotolerans]|uniref:PBP1A family penicillin-binding protein n=1 Tax=Oceanobacillus piezotolerans TaxID=2448030 RepID=A0A498D6S2_9BACI|nr:PBP1A family penicillin-binding protein [Oceanobacillus piezotolerans]RLL42854.1 PBP1A family penicillin-binding protein [Oceanobacillus piezotolerans]
MKINLQLLSKLFIRIIGLIVLSFLSLSLILFLLGPPSLTMDQNTIYYSSSGEVIGEEKGLGNRYWVELEHISPSLVDATLAIEDRHFYKHHGFDFKRIAGAILKNIQSMSLEEGASTLTQQLARNVYLSHEKTWSRKLKEAFYTVRIEMHYSKEEILEAYLNTIYFGHGAHGVEAASKHFFDKSAHELTLAESSMLAGIPKGPTYYSPFNHKVNAENRQQLILQTMLDNGYISEEAYQDAKSHKLVYAPVDEKEQLEIGPYFQDEVLNEAARLLKIDSESLRSGGYEIYTTMDIHMQKELEQAIQHTVPTSTELEVGAMALDPLSGAVRAIVGGKSYAESPFNRAMDAKRMAGSTFKPFLYYAALANGYTPLTTLASTPTTFELEDGEVYQPSNFNNYYAYEPISLAQAIALSDNIYAVKTNLFLTPERLVETASKFGISEDLPAVPSLALGTASVSVEEMVTAYGMLANGGESVTGYLIEEIKDRNGKVVYKRDKPKKELLLDPRYAFILTDLLTGMFDRALDGYTSVTGSPIINQLTRTYAGKSGTTISDSWMIGYSPSLVAGIWTGYDDNRPITLIKENSYAKQIWASFMESAHEGLPKQGFTAPPGVVAVPIDPVTGMRATGGCEESRIMYFEEGTEPLEACSAHYDSYEKVEHRGFLEELFDSFLDR